MKRADLFHRASPTSRRGLTLVELLAVLVILGLIAGTLTLGFSGSFGRAKHELARSGIAQIVQKLEIYRMEHDRWPSLEVGLEVLTIGQAAPSAAYFLEPDQLIDPWGRTYLYMIPGPEGRAYEVLTYGADGLPGGEGEDRDLSSAALRK
jgi:general secretion pathway protein G